MTIAAAGNSCIILPKRSLAHRNPCNIPLLRPGVVGTYKMSRVSDYHGMRFISRPAVSIIKLGSLLEHDPVLLRVVAYTA